MLFKQCLILMNIHFKNKLKLEKKLVALRIVKNDFFKNIVVFVLLLLFISMKSIGLHVLTHDDDHNHSDYCLVCDYAITHNFTPVLPTSEQTITFHCLFIPSEIGTVAGYHFIHNTSDIPNYLFSRPPPPANA